jgi:hypothetical protein
LLLAFAISAADWRFANPRPHGNNVLDMLYADGVVWQIGERGSIYTSINLDVWIPHESGTRKSLRSITAFGTNYFISGEEGLVLSGPRPSELILRELGTSDWLEGITASSNAVVAVGDNGAIYFSPDGVSWSRKGAFSTWLRSVAFGEDQFVTVGDDGFIATSTDGEIWIERNSGTAAHLNKVSWVNNRFWILGDSGLILTNNSTTTFSIVPSSVTNALFTISANTNEMVIAGDGIVLRSLNNGDSWIRESDSGSPLLAPNWPYYSSVWDGRLFLLSGQTGMLVEGFRTNDTAPLAWYSTFQPTRSWLWSIAHNGDFYTAVGVNGTIVTSENGADWVREVVPTNSWSSVLLGVGGDTNTILAVGSGGTLLRSENIFTNIISTNLVGEIVTNVVSLLGVVWEKIPTVFTNDFQGVVVTEDLFVVTGGNGTILTSSGERKGTIWIPQVSGVSTFISSVTPWPGGFVAVGASGVILTSPNAQIWTRQDSPVSTWIYSVKYLQGRLVAVGESGAILTSDDAENWQLRESGTAEWLNDVSYADGTWYSVGGDGVLVTSTDAISWRTERSITSKSLYALAGDGTQIVSAGREGIILRKNLSVATTPVEIVSYANVGFSSLFLFDGEIDQRFILEESESILGPWRPAKYLEIVESSGTLLFELPLDNAPMRFYRTWLLQPSF